MESLELHEYRPGRLEQAIANGIIDIGITYVPIPKAAFCRQGLWVSYLPSFVVALHNEKVSAGAKLIEHACPIPKSERSQSVFLVQPKQAPEAKLFRQVAKCLRSLS